MARDRREDERLGDLLLDVLSVDQPGAMWLVVYARDPRLLDPSRWGAIEAELSASPRYRDQLRVLRGFPAPPGILVGLKNGTARLLLL